MMRAPLETILSEFGKRAPRLGERADRAGALPDLQETLHVRLRSDLETSAKVNRDQWTRVERRSKYATTKAGDQVVKPISDADRNNTRDDSQAAPQAAETIHRVKHGRRTRELDALTS
jgi:hypothetical protein